VSLLSSGCNRTATHHKGNLLLLLTFLLRGSHHALPLLKLALAFMHLLHLALEEALGLLGCVHQTWVSGRGFALVTAVSSLGVHDLVHRHGMGGDDCRGQPNPHTKTPTRAWEQVGYPKEQM